MKKLSIAFAATFLLATLVVPTASAAPVKAYKNCTELRKHYPHGVAKKGYKNKGGALTGSPKVSNKLYSLNKKSDRDKDGIACEA